MELLNHVAYWYENNNRSWPSDSPSAGHEFTQSAKERELGYLWKGEVLYLEETLGGQRVRDENNSTLYKEKTYHPAPPLPKSDEINHAANAFDECPYMLCCVAGKRCKENIPMTDEENVVSREVFAGMNGSERSELLANSGAGLFGIAFTQMSSDQWIGAFKALMNFFYPDHTDDLGYKVGMGMLENAQNAMDAATNFMFDVLPYDFLFELLNPAALLFSLVTFGIKMYTVMTNIRNKMTMRSLQMVIEYVRQCLEAGGQRLGTFTFQGKKMEAIEAIRTEGEKILSLSIRAV